MSPLQPSAVNPAPAPRSAAEVVIRVLPPEVTARIAAGEVVERPASVVKELVENALDAGARAVQVEISAGGRERIRVIDDGCGLTAENLERCVLPHATSKITSADELPELATLGFRGEALPAVAAVSRFTLTTRPASVAADCAWQIEVAGGEPSQPRAHPASGAPGTVVEVLDLFYNLPARAKFLKGPAAEAAACTDVLQRLALTRPDVAFTLRQERHEVFALAACAEPGRPLPLAAYFRRAREVLGRANSQGLLELALAGPGPGQADAAGFGVLPESPPGYRLYGLISPPAIGRPNRGQIYLTVNGRTVKDRTLTSALLEAYRHLLEPKRFPIAVLYFQLPGADVDVNVHPTKAEVRFRLQGLVYALLHHAVRRTCGLREDPLASSTLPVSPPAVMTNSAPAVLPLGEAEFPQTGGAFDLWPKTAPAYGAAPAGTRNSDGRIREPAAVFAEPPAAVYRSDPPRPLPQAAPPQAAGVQAQTAFRVLGQAGGSFIVLEDDTGVKLIDQHAIHERILFERYQRAAASGARADAQGLLMAQPLELTPVQAATFNADPSTAQLLADLGFSVESFGPRTVAVSAVPAMLKNASAALVADVLDALAQTDDQHPAGRKVDRTFFRQKAIYVLACKGALKAGERLTHEQMTALVSEYRRCVSGGGFTCPHGRPVALEVTWAQLDRAVGR